jgi:hypothetical protein
MGIGYKKVRGQAAGVLAVGIVFTKVFCFLVAKITKLQVCVQ